VDFIPHTPADDRDMLEAVGASEITDLFEPIPDDLRLGRELRVPAALSEPELLQHLGDLARRSRGASDLKCFAGGGAYDHHIPPVVKSLAARAEFATSYTPYQPELSQGVLQAIYEFQSLVCEIYGMEVANASLYDGAHALVEAVNLCVRATTRNRIVVGATVHPHFVDVLRTYTSGLDLDISVAPFGPNGIVAWDEVDVDGTAAVVYAQPNFFGLLEDAGAAVARAHDAGARAVAVADPTATGVIRPPGQVGADVAVGEGQALGTALSYGGPYVGLFATTMELVRQVPGRIAGLTVDRDGRRAFVLTLQAREQHIRRARATSNVCTNQTLMAIAAGIHLAWLGPEGLGRLGEVCARRTAYAAAVLGDLNGCSIAFGGPRFKELVLEVAADAEQFRAGLVARGYLVGPALGRYYPELSRCLLVAVTERRTQEDIDGLAEAIEKELAEA
jgi:glycine dehydrogenase subunit 1